MSFRDNLQHLRATRNLTQEQLAMLLGVSRQSVTKWESERAYPEMDKLLKLCSIFECTLDELVQGDLTDRPVTTAAAPYPSIPEDTCGYDAHMRSRAWHISLGVAAIILGAALAALIDGAGDTGVFSAVALFAGVLIGIALIAPTAIAHGAFVRAHPFIEDFYTPEEKQSANRLLARGIVCGIGCIFLGVLCCAFLEAAGTRDQVGSSLMLTFAAIAVGCFVYTGLMHARVNLATYNREVAEELTASEIAALPDAARREHLMASKRRSRLTGSTCGIIMLTATIVGLALLFIPTIHTPYFWLSWVFGGICCGIASIAIEGFSRS